VTAGRLRRSTDEVRGLILDSARTLFSVQGYEATSTREIVEHAGVAESMLFRHFGSKQALFDEAMLKPFVEFVQTFIDDWNTVPVGEVVPAGLAYRFISGFSKQCADNRDLIEMVSGGDAHGDDRPIASQASEVLEQLVTTLAKQVTDYHIAVRRGFEMDPKLSVRLTIALIVGVAQLGEGFFGSLDGDDELVSEMAAFVVRGAGYPGDSRVGRGKREGPGTRSRRK
jgi:AcrR family transcriptional regulator